MPKYARNLTVREINKIKQPGIYAIGHVKGLSLRVNNSGGASYVYRYRIAAISRSITIGNKNSTPLKEAINLALHYSIVRIQGKDPMLEKTRQRQTLISEINQGKREAAAQTFSCIANKYLNYRRDSGAFLHNPRAEQTYSSMLVNHVYPHIKNSSISRIGPKDIRDILSKIWRSNPALSSKVLYLLKQIFDWAIAMNIYQDPNPASLEGPLKTLMEPFQTGRAEAGHYASLDYHDIPDFMHDLWKIGTTGAKGLMLSILTATRSKAIRKLTWDQLDLLHNVWEIPLENDKSKKGNRIRTIMLSDAAINLIKSINKRDTLVFPSSKLTPLSDAVFGKVIKDLNAAKMTLGEKPYVDNNILDNNGNPISITQHGTARATFKTWSKSDELGNHKKFDSEAVELCLLHDRKDPLKGAYDRSTLEKERRKIMNEWGKFCCSKIPELIKDNDIIS